MNIQIGMADHPVFLYAHFRFKTPVDPQIAALYILDEQNRRQGINDRFQLIAAAIQFPGSQQAMSRAKAKNRPPCSGK